MIVACFRLGLFVIARDLAPEKTAETVGRWLGRVDHRVKTTVLIRQEEAKATAPQMQIRHCV